MMGSWFDGWAGSWFGSWFDSLRLGATMAGGAAQEVFSWATLALSIVAGWLLVIGLVAAWLVARAASGRGRSGFGWLLLALLMTPPLAGLLLLLLPDRAENRQRLLASRGRAGLRLCPSCAEVIRAEARCCRYCGVDLVRLDRQSQPAVAGRAVGGNAVPAARAEPRLGPGAGPGGPGQREAQVN